MNPNHLLLAIITLAAMVILFIIAAVIAGKARARADLMYNKLYTATERFQKFKTSILEANDSLQLQLEAAEIKWADARDQLEYQKRENASYLRQYKKLEGELVQLKDDYGLLLNKCNALTLQKQFNDDLPT